jgi:hypothetical protein
MRAAAERATNEENWRRAAAARRQGFDARHACTWLICRDFMALIVKAIFPTAEVEGITPSFHD